MEKKYPFKFLDAYTREDLDIFFGRKDEVEQLYEMVFQTDLILVYGASGTGKTSLIQCGLAGKFQSHDWLDLFIRRGNNLNESFERALESAGGHLAPSDDDLNWLDQDFSAEIEEDTTTTAQSPLSRRLKAIYLQHFKPIYLIFDQFEELYILGNKEEQEQFVQTVKELLLVEQPVKLIISIREEYLGYLYEFEKEVPELLRKKLRVEPMNLDKVRTVITNIGTADYTNISLKANQEAEIAEQIFEKIRGEERKLSIPLTYLQVFLDKLYLETTGDESRTVEATFDLKGLQKMEGIEDVLRDFLDGQVLQISRDLGHPPDTIWRILSPFVTLDGTKEPLALESIEQRFNDLPNNLIDNVLQTFEKSRILRYNEDNELYEIAHDSLALQIHSKRSQEEIAILEVQRLIRSQMALKEDARAFLPEDQLDLVDLYQDKLILNPEEQAYLKASRAEVTRQKRQRTRFRQLIGLVTVAVLVSLSVLTLWALREQGKAEVSRQEAEDALNNFKLEQKIKVAKELEIYGDNYRDLGKEQDALNTYKAARDSLRPEAENTPLFQEISDKIDALE